VLAHTMNGMKAIQKYVYQPDKQDIHMLIQEILECRFNSQSLAFLMRKADLRSIKEMCIKADQQTCTKVSSEGNWKLGHGFIWKNSCTYHEH
jgi:hypothetical protein